MTCREAVFDVLRAPRRVVAHDEPVIDELAETFSVMHGGPNR
jgi:hypothetical protein